MSCRLLVAVISKTLRPLTKLTMTKLLQQKTAGPFLLPLPSCKNGYWTRCLEKLPWKMENYLLAQLGILYIWLSVDNGKLGYHVQLIQFHEYGSSLKPLRMKKKEKNIKTLTFEESSSIWWGAGKQVIKLL